MSAEQLMVHLSEYLDELTRIIMHYGGTVDKYIGDAIMAFWGAPLWQEDHAILACRAALKCQKKISSLNLEWKEKELPPLNTRIGLNTGDTIVGNMGSTDRMNFSAIGDTVNLASRLEGVNKYYGTSIMVSESTYKQAKNYFIFRYTDKVKVKGKKQAIKIFELIAEK
jgi:adenylate cyclase